MTPEAGAHARGSPGRELGAAFSRDLVHALRRLAGDRTTTAVAVLTLALGIGAMTSIFSVVESVVLRPLPFADPQRVVSVFETWKGEEGNVSVGNFLDLAAASRALSPFAARQLSSVNLAGDGRAERVLAARVTSGFFAVFGARPALGRTFSAEEDRAGERLAVLSHALWVRSFGADRGVLGRGVQLSGRSYEIVGVMPAGFDPLLAGEELWLPFSWSPAERAQHDEHSLAAIGRLRPAVSLARARSELGAAMGQLALRYPEEDGGRGIAVRPVADVLVGDYRQRLLLLLGAVSLVMLIACGNVANLLLAQGAARAREIAVRAAIGAGSRRLALQVLTESAVLAVLAAAAGTGLAELAVRVLLASAPPRIPRLAETRIDAGVLAFSLVLGVASSLVFGLAPAMRAARQGPQQVLKLGERGMVAVRDRLRSSLVLSEVALALTLLAGAGLLVRSARNLQSVDNGFDPRGVVMAQVSLPDVGYEGVERVQSAFEAILARLASAPGVASAAVVSRAPLGPESSSNGLLPEGKPFRLENLVIASLHVATPGYFATLRIPLLRGRLFTAGDVAGRERVMVVSAELARHAFGGADPVGRQLACCDGSPEHPSWKTVVGVVGDVRAAGPAVPPSPAFYLPLAQMPPGAVDWLHRSMMLVARGTAPGPLTAALGQAVREVDPTVPVYGISDLARSLHASTAEVRFQTFLYTALGAVGLLLALAGIYSMTAYFISLRRREIAVRLALGATPRDILGLLVWQGARPIAAGIAVGGLAAVASTRWLRGSLHGVPPTDPLTFAAVALLLVAAGLAATWIPARRATRVAPAQALQSE
jgi:putative ABC transport system permease protein